MYGGKFAFKNRLGQPSSWKEIYRFSLFHFVFDGNFQVQAPRGGLYLEVRFNGGFLRYNFWGLIFGGAYTWRGLFLEFYGIRRELPTLYFEFNWKNNLFAKRVRTNIGRVTAKTYSGDRHFHNVRYFNILNALN